MKPPTVENRALASMLGFGKTNVNRAQKILTGIFLAAFIATLIWFPWVSPYNPANIYRPFFVRPYYANYAVRPIWFQEALEWVALAVIYTGLLAILKSRRS